MKELREAGQHEEARKRMLRLAKESRTTPKSNSSAPGFTTLSVWSGRVSLFTSGL